MHEYIKRVERFSKTKQLFFFSLVFLCTVSFGVFLGTFIKFISVTQLLDRQQQIRKEQDELERIYEATWLELENAIGSQAAEAIRKSVEETTEAGAVQQELPLETKRTFDLEGEATCNQ